MQLMTTSLAYDHQPNGIEPPKQLSSASEDGAHGTNTRARDRAIHNQARPTARVMGDPDGRGGLMGEGHSPSSSEW